MAGDPAVVFECSEAPRGGKPSRRRALAYVVCAGLVAAFGIFAGCTQDTPWFGNPGQAATRPVGTQPISAGVFPSAVVAGADGVRPIILQVRFDVLRASVPLGEVSQSNKIWNHVEEGVVAADWAAHLHRNGLRVGRGTTQSWAPIRAILESTRNARTRSDSVVTRGGGAVTLEVSGAPRDQVLFLHRPGGGMAGATFAHSVNALRIEYAVPPTEMDSVELWILPEIRQRDLGPGWQVTRGEIQPRPTEASRVLRELAFHVVVPADQFVVIGPSSQIRRQLLIGRAMLTESIDGQTYESLYFITPRVIRVGGPPGVGAREQTTHDTAAQP